MSKYIQEAVSIAQARGQSYQWFVGILASLPDSSYYKYIYSSECHEFLMGYRNLQDPSMARGIDDLLTYLSRSKEISPSLIIDELAVDRTALLRTPFSKAYKPPYESMYSKSSSNAILLELKKVYSETGFVPDGTPDAPDFLCIELDFMRVQNNQLLNEPTRVGSLLQQQHRFLQDHLGSWLHQYCRVAGDNAETLFFKGVLQFLSGYIQLESRYLEAWK
jgi:TorA maturation chaperone TorD